MNLCELIGRHQKESKVNLELWIVEWVKIWHSKNIQHITKKRKRKKQIKFKMFIFQNLLRCFTKIVSFFQFIFLSKYKMQVLLLLWLRLCYLSSQTIMQTDCLIHCSFIYTWYTDIVVDTRFVQIFNRKLLENVFEEYEISNIYLKAESLLILWYMF